MFVISWLWRRGAPDVAFAAACARRARVCFCTCACARTCTERLSLCGFRAGGQEDAASYCLTTINLQPCSTLLVYFANKVNAHFIWVPGGKKTTLIVVALVWASLSNSGRRGGGKSDCSPTAWPQTKVLQSVALLLQIPLLFKINLKVP